MKMDEMGWTPMKYETIFPHLPLRTMMAAFLTVPLIAGGCFSSSEQDDGATDPTDLPAEDTTLDDDRDPLPEILETAGDETREERDPGIDPRNDDDGPGEDGETPQGECCTNLEDDDGDGAADCEDPDCLSDPSCTPCREGREICWDGCDNDHDCRIDGDDADDCWCPHACSRCDCRPGPELCDNLCDDDRDGAIDCEDPDCQARDRCGACVPTADEEVSHAACMDGFDNDCDGWTDCCDEPTCAFWTVGCDVPWPERCDDGIENDLDGLIDCADIDCTCDIGCTGIVWSPEDCDNGVDDDLDGRIDADDYDCPKPCP